MPITAVRLVSDNHLLPSKEVDETEVRRRLKPYGLRVRKTSLSSIKLEEVSKDVAFIKRKEGNLLIIPYDKMRSLVGSRRRRESVMRFTAMKSGGITFDDMFAQRAIDGYKIVYCRQEVAIVVNASRFIEKLS